MESWVDEVPPRAWVLPLPCCAQGGMSPGLCQRPYSPSVTRHVLLSELGLAEDDVGDKEEAGESPEQHKAHPEGVAEGGPVLVDVP